MGLRLARGLIALGFHPWAWNSAGIKARDEIAQAVNLWTQSEYPATQRRAGIPTYKALSDLSSPVLRPTLAPCVTQSE